MRKRTIWIVVVIAGLAAAGIFLLRSGATSGESGANQSGDRKPAPAVRVIAAAEETISRGLELTGSVEPYRVARLASPAEGPITDIRVREGDRVRAGDLLLSLGRKEGADALIDSLREELKKEEDNLRRTRRLVESEALPGENLDQARAAFEKVRALLIKAEEAARDYTIQAPWDGLVSRLPVKEGEFVAPRAVLLEIYDPSSLVILAAVPERHAAEIAVDMQVDLRLDAYPEEVFPGRVERVYPFLDPGTRTRTMEVVPDRALQLLPGMFARLKVLLESADPAVVVPAEAVVTTPKGLVVFVVEKGAAVARPVKTGIEADNRVQIISGVRPGDQVIVAGNEKLKTGAAVRVAGDEKAGWGENQGPAAPPAEHKAKAAGDGQ